MFYTPYIARYPIGTRHIPIEQCLVCIIMSCYYLASSSTSFHFKDMNFRQVRSQAEALQLQVQNSYKYKLSSIALKNRAIFTFPKKNHVFSHPLSFHLHCSNTPYNPNSRFIKFQKFRKNRKIPEFGKSSKTRALTFITRVYPTHSYSRCLSTMQRPCGVFTSCG